MAHHRPGTDEGIDPTSEASNTPHTEGGSEMIITADQVRAGDIVEYGGVRHLVTEVRRPVGAAWPVACDGAGWAIALGSQPLVVQRPALAPLLAA